MLFEIGKKIVNAVSFCNFLADLIKHGGVFLCGLIESVVQKNNRNRRSFAVFAVSSRRRR